MSFDCNMERMSETAVHIWEFCDKSDKYSVFQEQDTI